MSNYYRRTRSRSREPPTTGQNVEVFTPLPSLHTQQRQQFRTGERLQFGANNRSAPSNYRTPARDRVKSHVREVDPRDLLAANLATQPKSPAKRAPMTNRIIQDNRRKSTGPSPQKRGRSVNRENGYDDGIPEKRGRGRPPLNQNYQQPSSSSRRNGYTPRPATHYNQGSSRNNNRNTAERDVAPVRNGGGRRSVDPPPVNESPMTRARSRAASRGPDYDDIPQARFRGSERAAAAPARNRTVERQQPAPARNRTVERQQPANARNRTPNQQATRRSVQPRRSTERARSAASAASVEIIDPPPEQQQPSSSTNRRSNAQAPAAPTEAQRIRKERKLENREPCIATMVVKLYNPARNHNVPFAPNIFAYQAIRDNVNGLNTISAIFDIVRNYEANRNR